MQVNSFVYEKEEFIRNSSPSQLDCFDHKNPLYRNKFHKKNNKENQKTRKLSFTSSGDHFYNFSSWNSKLKNHGSDIEQKIKMITMRLEKNEFEIERLLQKQKKEKKIQKQLKELFIIVRDHKSFENKINQKFSIQINELKNSIEKIRNNEFQELSNNIEGQLKKIKAQNQDIYEICSKQSKVMNIHKLQLLNPKIKSLRCEKPFEIKVREYIRNFADPVHEFKYFVDESGYLLDSDSRYLTDQNQNIIQICPDLRPLVDEKGYCTVIK